MKVNESSLFFFLFFAVKDVSVKNVVELKEPLADTVEKLEEELKRNENTVAQSMDHAVKLKQEADDLQGTLDYTKAYADNAIVAATSYKKIVNALNASAEHSIKAKKDAENATNIINKLHDAGEETTEPSRNLLVRATSYLRQVEEDLKIPLKDEKTTIHHVEGANNITSYSLNNVQK